MQPTSTTTDTSPPDPALPAAAPADAAHHTTACLNCEQQVPGNFCAHCGQPADTHRITLRHLLLHDLPHSVWHVDKGLIYTLRQMLTRPGDTLREYMAGRRAQHFRPITYLLMMTAITVLLMSSMHFNPLPSEGQEEVPRLLKLGLERYIQLYYKYAALVYVVLLPINALLAAWLLRPVRFNFAEMLLSHAFISGTTTVISALYVIPTMLLMSRFPALQPFSFIGMVPYIIYTIWVYRQLLEPTRMPVEDKWVRSIGTVVLQTIVLFVTCILALGAILFTLARQDPSLLDDFRKSQQKAKASTSQPAPRR